MKSDKSAIRIVRGYARHEKDSNRLKAKGVKTIYRADEGETLGKFKMRKGEYLGVVDGLLAFGDTRREMAAAVDVVHGWGATIIDAETGQNSRTHGVRMLHEALSPPKPSAEYMAELQAKAARSRTKGRMPHREALAIWRNPKLSTEEAIELMTGWTQPTAYVRLGPRGMNAGRRRKLI